jgi:tripartite-type tricarboxylate transporter receptor subunit TctC
MRSQSSQADRRAVLRRAGILLGGELLRVKADVRIGVVPFKGSAPLAQDLVAGNIPMAVDNLSTHAGLLQAGKLRALAVLQDARVATSPDIPSTAELGLPEVTAVGWSGVSVRAGTPSAIIDRLARELDRICKLPAVRARFESGGSQLVGGTPADFARHLQIEARKWQGLIRNLGIKAA